MADGERSVSIGKDATNVKIDTGDKYVVEAVTPIVPALHQLPQPPADFTGRESELNELRSAIGSGGVTISGLHGLGGVGKTTLALKLAQDLKSEYPDAQFYLDLKGADAKPLPVDDAFSHVIRAFHPTAKLPEGEAELRGLYNSVLEGKRALMLMDNARDAAQVLPLIPPIGCLLLVTSRQHFTLPGLFAKDLNILPADDAQKLLLTIAPRIGDHATSVAGLCGYLPLALRLAASTLQQRTDLTVDDYLRRLTMEHERLKLIDQGKLVTGTVGVEASISTSYDLLSPVSRGRWAMLSVFPGSFDRTAVAAVWEVDEDVASDTLGELRNYSLVEWDDGLTRYRLHDLVRLLAADRLVSDERAIGRKRHARYYETVLRTGGQLYELGGQAILGGLSLYDHEWENIRTGYSWALEENNSDSEAAKLCIAYPLSGTYLLLLRQHPRDQIRWLEVAVAAARRLKMRQQEGFALGNLGLAYWNLGENVGALAAHEQDLTIEREIGNRRAEGNALGNLGGAHLSLGNIERATELFEQQLNIAREIDDKLGLGNALGGLGNAYFLANKHRQAIEFYEQQLTITWETGDRLGEGSGLGNIGSGYFALGDSRRAIEFFEQQLGIKREIGDRRGEGNALWNMSLALHQLGHRRQAIRNASSALEIFEQIEAPFIAKVRAKLAEWRGEK